MVMKAFGIENQGNIHKTFVMKTDISQNIKFRYFNIFKSCIISFMYFTWHNVVPYICNLFYRSTSLILATTSLDSQRVFTKWTGKLSKTNYQFS